MFVMNKNVNHAGKSYNKGFIVEKDDNGFEELKKAGHVEEAVKAEGHVDGAEAYKKYHKKDEDKVEASSDEQPSEGSEEHKDESEDKPARRRR